MAKKARLTLAQKIFLAQCFGQFLTPTEAVRALKERFGIEITDQSAARYDPERPESSTLAVNLRGTLVEKMLAARKDFEDKVDAIPEAKQAVRVRDLAAFARHYKSVGNYRAAADVYAQIAREVGGGFTNRHEHTGKGGGPIETKNVEGMTLEQIRAEIAAIVNPPKPDADPD